MSIELALKGAMEAKHMIESCYDQSAEGFRSSILEKNESRKVYWLERICHLMEQLNWIDRILLKIKAADTAASDDD